MILKFLGLHFNFSENILRKLKKELYLNISTPYTSTVIYWKWNFRIWEKSDSFMISNWKNQSLGWFTLNFENRVIQSGECAGCSTLRKMILRGDFILEYVEIFPILKEPKEGTISQFGHQVSLSFNLHVRFLSLTPVTIPFPFFIENKLLLFYWETYCLFFFGDRYIQIGWAK